MLFYTDISGYNSGCEDECKTVS